MLLRDDALGLLLPVLKDHLELVQVCLGEIHAWAMQPSNYIAFLNLDIRELIRIPTEITSLYCCLCGHTKSSYTCTENRCGKRIVLKRFENKATYYITDESEQDRLLKFINFMGS